MTLPYVADDFVRGPAKRLRKRYTFTADGEIAQPAYTAIRRIWIDERAGNAVTGGVDIGTTNGGQQILAALAVGANATVEAAPVISNYQAAADILYVTAASAWNSAEIVIMIDYDVVSAAAETV
jgi:hypothetical protein